MVIIEEKSGLKLQEKLIYQAIHSCFTEAEHYKLQEQLREVREEITFIENIEEEERKNAILPNVFVVIEQKGSKRQFHGAFSSERIADTERLCADSAIKSGHVFTQEYTPVKEDDG